MARYTQPRSDTPNEGTGPNERKYVPRTLTNYEKFARNGELLWHCSHCDALNQTNARACAQCGADRRQNKR